MELYPLKLHFIPKTAVWGGDRLKTDYGKETEVSPLGETWELAVRKNGDNPVENGTYGGMTLGEILKEAGPSWISDTQREGQRFPLLVKLIDAKEKLSLQVHPGDEYAFLHEDDGGKTEIWVILDALPGSKIIYGQKEGVTRSCLTEGLREKRFGEVLREQEVKKGEVYFIPAGMVHALGAGITVAEIQQNSDLTYRVYDYNRKEKDGTLRPLQLEKALEVSTVFSEDDVSELRFSRNVQGDGILCCCPYFTVKRLRVTGHTAETAGKESFHHLLCLQGGGSIRHSGKSYPILEGGSYFIPAGLGEYDLYGDMEILVTSLM